MHAVCAVAADAAERNVKGLQLSVTLQVRQHTSHKRTFFFLEQLILKHNIDQLCINVKEMHEARLLHCCRSMQNFQGSLQQVMVVICSACQCKPMAPCLQSKLLLPEQLPTVSLLSVDVAARLSEIT